MILEFNGITPDISKAAFIAEDAVICGDVVLEEGVSIWFGSVLRGDCGRIHVGRNTNIQDRCVIHCDHGGRTEIGANVTVGHSAVIHGCTIEDDCMIGMGSIIMNNAVIREHSLVGAGSLVTNDRAFAPGSLILGSPAKRITSVPEEYLEEMREGAEEYLAMAQEYRKNVPPER